MTSKDVSEEAQHAMKALAAKLEDTVSLWRNRLREDTAARGDDAPEARVDTATSDLRQQLAGLEQDAATLQKDLDRESAAATEWEQRAMTAVTSGNDVAAREALEHQGRHSEVAATIQAELTLLHAMQQACRDVLDNVHYRAATISSDIDRNRKG